MMADTAVYVILISCVLGLIVKSLRRKGLLLTAVSIRLILSILFVSYGLYLVFTSMRNEYTSDSYVGTLSTLFGLGIGIPLLIIGLWSLAVSMEKLAEYNTFVISEQEEDKESKKKPKQS
jgi:hypothetical protein